MTQTFRAVLCVSLAVAAAACASESPLEPGVIRLTVNSATPTATFVELLRVSATIANGESERLVLGNCSEPTAVIDSATAAGWIELPTLQSISLVQCVAPLAIEANTAQTFDLSFSRPRLGTFPRGVALRLRIVRPDGEPGPVAPLQLP